MRDVDEHATIITLWSGLSMGRRQSLRSGPADPSRWPLHQILLADGDAEPVTVGDEFDDELVQAALENLLHPGVFEARTDGPGLALGQPLPAIGAGNVI